MRCAGEERRATLRAEHRFQQRCGLVLQFLIGEWVLWRAFRKRDVALDRAPVGPKGPVERVLPVVRERPPEVPTGAPLGDFGPDPALAPLALPPEGATSTSSGGPPDFPPGITSTGGPPITSTSTSGGPPVNPPPVPEPATWMMMILGFGVVGSAIRRQNTIRRAAARG